MQNQETLADDLIHGADALAEEIYGDRKQRRKVYRLWEQKREGRSDAPIFKLNGQVCGRRSAWRQFIQRLEA